MTDNAIVVMGREEAREIVNQVKAHLNEARRLLLDLYEREGWRALGYASWRECVKAEFQHSEPYLYRQLAAAQLESDLGLEVGESPEYHLRPIIEVFGDDREGARQAYESALIDGAETSSEFRYHARREWLLLNLPEESSLYQKVVQGDVSMLDAYNIALIMGDDDTPLHAVNVIDECTDYRLADRLVAVCKHLPHIWEEISSTKSIPSLDGNIPLGEASKSNLNALIGVDNAERRAQHVAINEEYYREVRKRTRQALALSEGLARLAINFRDLEDAAKKVIEALEGLREIVGDHRDDISPIAKSD